VDIGADKTCIDCKAFAANKPFGHAALDGHLEQLAQQVTARLRPGDLCLTIVAGDITRLSDEIIAWLTNGTGES
jgi:UDP-N-acetylmuramate-alanine ligase